MYHSSARVRRLQKRVEFLPNGLEASITMNMIRPTSIHQVGQLQIQAFLQLPKIQDLSPHYNSGPLFPSDVDPNGSQVQQPMMRMINDWAFSIILGRRPCGLETMGHRPACVNEGRSGGKLQEFRKAKIERLAEYCGC